PVPPRRPAGQPAPAREPAARAILRVSFGVLWIIDGVLQAQPQMAGGLPSQVTAPSATASPQWVRDVVDFGASVWSFHPVQAATAAVWIQLGLGLWLLVADAGWWSRLGGLASAAWGLVVWVFGEAFGGIFAPGLSWLSGAPGAVVLYIVAGALLAAPARAWAGRRLGRILLAGTGASWLGLAVLQAWPGRGFWHGGEDGSLTGMISDMAGLPQPRLQADVVNGFASLASHHAFAVNLVAVVALAASGLALLSGRPRVLRAAVPAVIAFCLAVWVLIQDLGMPGGLGTDPNSMIPWALLTWAGYRAATGPQTQPHDSAERIVPPAQRPRLLPLSPRGFTLPVLATIGALGTVLVGTVPMALASVSRHADPIIARAVAGGARRVDLPAPGFRLVSQAGQPVSLASLRGKVLLLTFLDPACTAECPVTTELREASSLLGEAGKNVELVAIAASQRHYGLAYVRALDRREGLATSPNWLFLTGSLGQLERAWGGYGIHLSRMVHASSVMSDMVFVIDAAGRIREEVADDPGPGTIATRSSYAVLLADAARQAMGA
ncbi:MAG: SCO family protein, partial [Nocardiopsaceae bacterium]|nr:SCO family protein [Nocardiopsaceae bacterium]